VTETIVGVPVRSYENRTASLCRGSDGMHHLVICARDCVVSVSLERGTSAQVFYPEGEAGYAFSSLPSSRGRVYTGAGKRFFEFDPARGEFLRSCAVPTADCAAFALAEADDGGIWFANYPDCSLHRFDPERGSCEPVARLDETEKYPQSMVFDPAGWIYTGVGTERAAIHGYCVRTGELRTWAAAERTRGSGVVFCDRGGALYGVLNDSRDAASREVVLLRDGAATPVADPSVPARAPRRSFDELFTVPGQESCVERFSLEDREVVYRSPASGERVSLRIDYRMAGTQLSPLCAGPDGRIYGGSNHPFHFYIHDPGEGGFRYTEGRSFLVGRPNPTIGTTPGDRIGGNICAYTWVGGVMYGAMYAGGYLVRFDPRAAVEPGTNPRNVATHEEIHRPRCLAALPDGRRVVWSGFGGYGDAGGGLCVYDTVTGDDTLVQNLDLVRYHSIFCLDNLGPGRLVAGTSTFTPGGAQQRERNAVLFVLDTDGLTVGKPCVPAEGHEQVTACLADRNGAVHGVTNRSAYFVWDPASGAVAKREDCGRFGAPVQAGGVRSADGELYFIFERAVTRVDVAARCLRPVHAAVQPITIGGAVLEGAVYFGCGPELRRCG
jgi:hypothetical protein